MRSRYLDLAIASFLVVPTWAWHPGSLGQVHRDVCNGWDTWYQGEHQCCAESACSSSRHTTISDQDISSEITMSLTFSTTLTTTETAVSPTTVTMSLTIPYSEISNAPPALSSDVTVPHGSSSDIPRFTPTCRGSSSTTASSPVSSSTGLTSTTRTESQVVCNKQQICEPSSNGYGTASSIIPTSEMPSTIATYTTPDATSDISSRASTVISSARVTSSHSSSSSSNHTETATHTSEKPTMPIVGSSLGTQPVSAFMAPGILLFVLLQLIVV